jgi:hypothetical protein
MLGLVAGPSPAGLALAYINGFDSPNQLHLMYAYYSAQKGYNYRKKGLKVKYNCRDDLQVFQNKGKAHPVDCVMDSICMD